MTQKIKSISIIILLIVICFAQLRFIYFTFEFKILHQDAAICNQIRNNMFLVSYEREVYYRTNQYYDKYRNEDNVESLSKYIRLMDSMYLQDQIAKRSHK
jgi:hypothetical protein